MKAATPEQAITQHQRAVATLQMAQLKRSNLVSVIDRTGKPRSPKQQRALDAATDKVQRAESAVVSASQRLFFAGSPLAPPKGVIVAPTGHLHQTRVLNNKPATAADVAATATLPNTLWARVRNFWRAPF